MTENQPTRSRIRRARTPKTRVRRLSYAGADAALLHYEPDEDTAFVSIPVGKEEVEVDASLITLWSAYLRARPAFASDSALARALDVDRTRLTAWKKAQAEPRRKHLRILADLATVSDELRRFLHPHTVGDWLTTEQPELDGQTPIRALREGRLADVLRAANATEHGAFG